MGVTLVTVWSMFVFVHSSAGLQCYTCNYVNITDHSQVPDELLTFPNSSDACQPGKTPSSEFIKPCKTTDSNKIFTCVTSTEDLTYAVIHSHSCIQVSNDSTWLNQCGNYSREELEADSDLEQILLYPDDVTEAMICSCTENCTSVNHTIKAVPPQTTMKPTTQGLPSSISTTPCNTNRNQGNFGCKPVVSFLMLVLSVVFTAGIHLKFVE